MYGPAQFTEEDIEVFRKNMRKEIDVQKTDEEKNMKLEDIDVTAVKKEVDPESIDEKKPDCLQTDENCLNEKRISGKLLCSSCGVSIISSVISRDNGSQLKPLSDQ